MPRTTYSLIYWYVASRTATSRTLKGIGTAPRKFTPVTKGYRRLQFGMVTATRARYYCAAQPRLLKVWRWGKPRLLVRGPLCKR